MSAKPLSVDLSRSRSTNSGLVASKVMSAPVNGSTMLNVDLKHFLNIAEQELLLMSCLRSTGTSFGGVTWVFEFATATLKPVPLTT